MTATISPTSSALRLCVGVLVAALIVSGLAPFDRLTWVMETAPIMIVLPILIATHRRLPLTPLLYGLIAIHGVILAVGGAYTYAHVPMALRCRIGCIWRATPTTSSAASPGFRAGPGGAGDSAAGWLRHRAPDGAFLSLCVVMLVHANYELIEWWSALAMGQGADEFLGTQGDPWDTQSDMFCALIGGGVAVFTLARWQDRQIAGLGR